MSQPWVELRDMILGLPTEPLFHSQSAPQVRFGLTLQFCCSQHPHCLQHTVSSLGRSRDVPGWWHSHIISRGKEKILKCLQCRFKLYFILLLFWSASYASCPATCSFLQYHSLSLVIAISHIKKTQTYSATMIPALEGLLLLLFQSQNTPSWCTGFVFALKSPWHGLLACCARCALPNNPLEICWESGLQDSPAQVSPMLVLTLTDMLLLGGYCWESSSQGVGRPWTTAPVTTSRHHGHGLNVPEAPLTFFLPISIHKFIYLRSVQNTVPTEECTAVGLYSLGVVRVVFESGLSWLTSIMFPISRRKVS